MANNGRTSVIDLSNLFALDHVGPSAELFSNVARLVEEHLKEVATVVVLCYSIEAPTPDKEPSLKLHLDNLQQKLLRRDSVTEVRPLIRRHRFLTHSFKRPKEIRTRSSIPQRIQSMSNTTVPL